MTWFRLDPGEFLLRPELQGLPPDARCLLIDLTFRALAGIPIRDDANVHRRAYERQYLDWELSWGLVREVLEVEPDGTLSWSWLREVQAEQAERQTKDAERMARARRLSRERTRTNANERERTRSSATDGRTDGRTDGHTHAAAARNGHVTAPALYEEPASPGAGKPRVPSVTKKVRKEPTGPHAEFIAWWCRAFQERTGRAYAFQGSKDGPLVSSMLKALGGDVGELRERAIRLMTSPPAWVVKDGGGINLGTLSVCLNSLVAAADAVQPLSDLDRIIAERKASARTLTINGHSEPRRLEP